jgi:hypothetical protein
MENLAHYPLLLFTAVFVALWLASVTGSWLRSRNPSIVDEQKEDLGVILGATLTLLALMVGFSVSMASNRYDQRKSLEEAEANAIGTEILRADLLPPEDAANVRRLLGAYLDQRILFYINEDVTRQAEIDQRVSQLQAELWAAVRAPAAAQPTPIAALVLAGMNDVIKFAGLYTGGVLESDSTRRVVAHGDYRSLFQCAVRLSVARRQGREKARSRAAVYRLNCLPSDSRCRCAATWLDPRQSAEPGKPGEVAWTLR